MGGRLSKKKNKKAKQSFFSKFFSSGGGNEENNSDWNNIKHNKIARKARIDYLWSKARRYNNKLRL